MEWSKVTNQETCSYTAYLQAKESKRLVSVNF